MKGVCKSVDSLSDEDTAEIGNSDNLKIYDADNNFKSDSSVSTNEINDRVSVLRNKSGLV